MRSGLDRQTNLDAALALIAEAASRGAAFVTTPEMTNVVDGAPKRLLAELPAESELPEIAAFAEAARRHKITLLVGSLAVRVSDSRAANRSYFFTPDGEIAACYDKVHMFDVDLPDGERWRESNVYQPGEKLVLVQSALANFGLSICYDVRFPAHYRRLAQNGANVLCVPAAFTRQTGQAHWHSLLRARAIENGAFVLAAAQGGRHEDGRDTFGHSLIIDPWGDILAEAEGDEPGVILAEISPAKSTEARQRIPNLTLETAPKISIIKQ